MVGKMLQAPRQSQVTAARVREDCDKYAWAKSRLFMQKVSPPLHPPSKMKQEVNAHISVSDSTQEIKNTKPILSLPLAINKIIFLKMNFWKKTYFKAFECSNSNGRTSTVKSIQLHIGMGWDLFFSSSFITIVGDWPMG